MVRSTLLCQLGLLLAALDQVASISAQLDGEAQLYAPDDGGLWTPATAEASYFESLQQQQREPAADHSQTRKVNARAVNGCDDVRGPSAAKRWADDSDDDQRSPSRRRVSDSDKDGVMHHAPAGAHYLIARPPPVAHSRSPLQRSPKLEPPPRDWQARLESKSLVDSAVRV